MHIQEYPSRTSALRLDRGHRKSTLRSDSSQWGSYLAVGRYDRGRPAKSIRSGIVGIQSRRSVRPDATKPDRISGSTTLSRQLIRDHGVARRGVRRCRYLVCIFVDGPKCVRKLLRSQNRCSRRKALNEQKPVPARRAEPSNFRA